MIAIREASECDAEVLAELNAAFNSVQRGADHIRAQITASGSTETVLLAEELSSIVGFLCFQTLTSVCYDAPWCEITELYVVPSHRRRGAGRLLVAEVIRRAEEVNASELLVRTNSNNRIAQDLCAGIGLETVPQVVFRSTVAEPR